MRTWLLFAGFSFALIGCSPKSTDDKGQDTMAETDVTSLDSDTSDSGHTGDTGDTGHTGDTGDTGHTGDTGDTGSTGCPAGTHEDCFGGCSDEAAYGNDACDPQFACALAGWDGEDCDSGTTDPNPGDIGEGCSYGLVPDCNGGCSRNPSWLGDGMCDDIFACEAGGWDGGDCDNGAGNGGCAIDEVKGCDGSCVSVDAAGDGVCDAALDCATWYYDVGDCGTANYDDTSDTDLYHDGACPYGTHVAVDGLCRSNDYYGDGYCDAMFNSALAGWDGGDCDDGAGNGGCPVDQFHDCNGGCMDDSIFADYDCNEELNCRFFDFDFGNCEDNRTSCDADEVLTCGGVGCIDAEWLGDNVCDSVLNCEEANWDDLDCRPDLKWPVGEGCGVGTVPDCMGGCSAHIIDVSDGWCDEDFNCADANWDGGDCDDGAGNGGCAVDELKGCDGSCVGFLDLYLGGDGNCDAALDCALFNYDYGDCGDTGIFDTSAGSPLYGDSLGCPMGYVPNCAGGCSYSDTYGDRECNAAFNCADANWDNGDCGTDGCPVGQIKGCDDSCVFPAQRGDGNCDAALSCSYFSFDSGDCTDTRTVCNRDEVLNCSGTGCSPVGYIGDGDCDASLDCATYDFDDGDCP